MKKKLVLIALFTMFSLPPAQSAVMANPWAAIIKAAIKKVVQAVDLIIQRRQNAVIKLQNAQKALENTMSKLQLDEIADWVKKQRDLYKEYYEELRKVKGVIAYYFRVKQIAEKNSRLVDEYQKAWNLFARDNRFSLEEIAHMEKVYSAILEESAANVDLLLLVVKSFTTQMSDAKRLELIDRAAMQADAVYDDLVAFNRENSLLSLARARTLKEAETVRQLYGLE